MKFELNPITGKLDIAGADSGATKDLLYYTDADPTEEAHGGIAAGTTFDNEPITEVLRKILHKPTAPTISLTSTIKDKYFEKSTKKEPVLTITVAKKTSTIKSVVLLKNGKLFTWWSGDEVETIGASGKSFTAEVSFNEDVTWQATITDTEGRTSKSAVISYAFRLPVYYGLVGADALDGENLTLSDLGLKKALPSSDGLDEYELKYPPFKAKRFVFAFFGKITKIENGSFFDITNTMASDKAIKVAGLDGQERMFTLYYSTENEQPNGYSVLLTGTINSKG